MAVEPLSQVIGRRVRDLRIERGWSQRELAAALTELGSDWTRARVGQLETDGVRGDRLLDVALLCAALRVDLGTLLEVDAAVGSDEHPHPLAWVKSQLLEPADVPATTVEPDLIDPAQIGADDEAEVARLAQRAGRDTAQLRLWVAAQYDDNEPLAVRDALAQIDPTTTRRAAQAKRGHASRRLLKSIESGTVDEADRDQVLENLLWWAHARSAGTRQYPRSGEGSTDVND